MATVGLANLVLSLPPYLLANWHITTPHAQTLATCRVAGSDDATYGTIGWVPPIDGQPFCVIHTAGAQGRSNEPNRIKPIYPIELFVGVAQAETQAHDNFALLATAWLDAAWDTVARNRRFGAPGGIISAIAGDVEWEMQGGKLEHMKVIQGIPFYGMQISTTVSLVLSVTYQL